MFNNVGANGKEPPSVRPKKKIKMSTQPHTTELYDGMTAMDTLHLIQTMRDEYVEMRKQLCFSLRTKDNVKYRSLLSQIEIRMMYYIDLDTQLQQKRHPAIRKEIRVFMIPELSDIVMMYIQTVPWLPLPSM